MNYLVPVQIGAPDKFSSYLRVFNTMLSFRRLFSVVQSPQRLRAYLAGLWEGDGHIWIPKTTHAPSGKKYNPHFAITFTEYDYPLVLVLKTILGGTIRHKKENHAYVLTISSISGLLNIIYLINGYLRTPKLHQFNNLINWVNSHTGKSIMINSVDTSPILENAWLAGFIDADGSFDISIRDKNQDGSGRDRTELRMRIEQRKTDPITGESYLPVLESIAQALEVVLNNRTRNSGETNYVIAITSPAKHAIIIAYLDKFPLFSSKRLNYCDWKLCYNMMIDKQHLTSEGRSKIKTIKAGMNSKRFYYNWDHLEDLNPAFLS